MLSARSRAALDVELAAWSATGIDAKIWWRDDDAIQATPALQRLRMLSEALGVGIALACIPDTVERSLSELVAKWPLARVWQHGFAHINHAPPREKKAEFGAHRPLAAMAQELVTGRRRMEQMFADSFVPALVPPWNRIDSEVLRVLPAAGLRLLSTFKARQTRHPVPGVTCINTHVDIIDWRGSRAFAGEDTVVTGLLAHLSKRRLGLADIQEPTGILTHHLVHDTHCWSFLEDLFDYLARRKGVYVLHPDDVTASLPIELK